MNQTKTAQQVAAYIRAVVKKEIGIIRTYRKISEDYHWYTIKEGRRNAWRYKYYQIGPEPTNRMRAYEAYKLINDMSGKLKEMFGYTVNCQWSKDGFSLIYNVTPIK
jgi:hypothetical protein